MSQHEPEYIDLCAAWALGCLDPADQARLDQHLAMGCGECETAMAQFSAATVLVAASAPRVAPHPSLRQRVLSATASSATRDRAPMKMPERPMPREPRASNVTELRPRTPWPAWAPLALAAGLAVTSAVLGMQASRLSSRLAASRAQVAQLESKLSEVQKVDQVLTAPDARVSVLEATTDGDPRLRARATYDPRTKRAVVLLENFVKPNARDYELWVIRGGAPASLGLISADPAGHAMLQLENVGDSFALSAFAISLEPEGGSPNHAAPSGPVVMLGKLSG